MTDFTKEVAFAKSNAKISSQLSDANPIRATLEVTRASAGLSSGSVFASPTATQYVTLQSSDTEAAHAHKARFESLLKKAATPKR